jgi:hypothetical protein
MYLLPNRWRTPYPGLHKNYVGYHPHPPTPHDALPASNMSIWRTYWYRIGRSPQVTLMIMACTGMVQTPALGGTIVAIPSSSPYDCTTIPSSICRVPIVIYKVTCKMTNKIYMGMRGHFQDVKKLMEKGVHAIHKNESFMIECHTKYRCRYVCTTYYILIYNQDYIVRNRWYSLAHHYHGFAYKWI